MCVFCMHVCLLYACVSSVCVCVFCMRVYVRMCVGLNLIDILYRMLRDKDPLVRKDEGECVLHTKGSLPDLCCCVL